MPDPAEQRAAIERLMELDAQRTPGDAETAWDKLNSLLMENVDWLLPLALRGLEADYGHAMTIDSLTAQLATVTAERDRLRKMLLEWNEDSSLLPANPEEYTRRDVVAADGIITNMRLEARRLDQPQEPQP